MRIKGWKKVLKFTFMQTIKAKTFIWGTAITALLLSAMIALGNFLPGWLSDEPNLITDDQGNIIAVASEIDKVYIYNNTELQLDFSALPIIDVRYELISQDQINQIMERVTESDEAIVLTLISPNEHGSFDVVMSRPESTELINANDCFELLVTFEGIVRVANVEYLGITMEDFMAANAFIHTSVNVGGEEGRSAVAEGIGAVVTTVFSILLFVLIITYSQLTSQAIATEKSSRVMELLLTSIKPLAVVVGKVLASTLVVLFTVVIVGGVATATFFITAPYGAIGEIIGSVPTDDPMFMEIRAELPNAFAGFNPLNIALIVVIFVFGFLFYSLIAGLIGASVSKIEDLQTANQPLAILATLGLYMTYFPFIFGADNDNTLIILSRYLPISSAFALPPAILSGELSGSEIAIPLLVLIATLVLFALFVAKVYEHIILHNGDRVKIGDMIKMIKPDKEV
ncbi:MAG: ABC transporter permease [Oscillospiraceae bacterium]|nr:ABC transporter permease [Oscillospiraceae bacterium]